MQMPIFVKMIRIYISVYRLSIIYDSHLGLGLNFINYFTNYNLIL